MEAGPKWHLFVNYTSSSDSGQTPERQKFKFILTSRFSQDCLENFFSCVRRKNAVPSPLMFKNSLRVLTVAQYLKGADCGSYEQDDGSFLAEFIDTDKTQTANDDVTDSSVFDAYMALADGESSEPVVFDSIELNSLLYLGGYVVSRVKKNDVTCESCISSLLSVDCPNVLDLSVTKLVTLKEFSSDSLVYCSQAMFCSQSQHCRLYVSRLS